MSSDSIKYLLNEDRIPRDWYNLIADLPAPPPPVLHPGTHQPVGPDDLDLLLRHLPELRRGHPDVELLGAEALLEGRLHPMPEGIHAGSRPRDGGARGGCRRGSRGLWKRPDGGRPRVTPVTGSPQACHREIIVIERVRAPAADPR